jgi:hypothetical protein
MGGTFAKIQGFIAKGEAGDYGEDELKTIRTAFEAAQKVNDDQAREHRQQHVRALKSDPLLSKVPGQIDSAVAERFGEAGKFVPPPDAIKGKDRKTGQTIYQLKTGQFVDGDGEPVK